MKVQLALLTTLLIAGTAMAQEESESRPPKGEGFINRFDTDGDGQVSLEEFKGSDEHFEHMDKDGDGYISEEEAPKGPPPKRRGNQKGEEEGEEDSGQENGERGKGGFINRFDEDGDGQVSQDEFTGPDEHFEHMDKDGDGFISEEEAPKGPPPRQGGTRQGPSSGE